MEIREYAPEEFLERYLDVLEQNEALHQLILTNVFSDRERIGEGNFYLCLEEYGPRWFVCNHLPFSLLVFPADPAHRYKEEECASLLAGKLLSENRTITGIQSTPAFAERFLKEWGLSARKDLVMDVMVCKKAMLFPGEGIIRKADEKDIDVLTEMAISFYEEALHETKEKEELKENLSRKLSLPDADIFLYETEGHPAGMCASTRKLPHGRSVSYVYIEKPLRGRGYAKQMVSKVTADYLDDNRYVTLYVDTANPVSNRVYTDIGYEYTARVVNYRFVR